MLGGMQAKIFAGIDATPQSMLLKKISSQGAAGQQFARRLPQNSKALKNNGRLFFSA
jgi:hypothetical protein